ncbi:hypothetical protein U9M48_028758 [Paspalum notatum var. saurae]|uniref:Uncharacterized protein n=1 Tax=Paspalum notatum var. saurae TaxID=547442 RepID=A0AAQ3X0W6_PASNO
MWTPRSCPSAPAQPLAPAVSHEKLLSLRHPLFLRDCCSLRLLALSSGIESRKQGLDLLSIAAMLQFFQPPCPVSSLGIQLRSARFMFTMRRRRRWKEMRLKTTMGDLHVRGLPLRPAGDDDGRALRREVRHCMPGDDGRRRGDAAGSWARVDAVRRENT